MTRRLLSPGAAVDFAFRCPDTAFDASLIFRRHYFRFMRDVRPRLSHFALIS